MAQLDALLRTLAFESAVILPVLAATRWVPERSWASKAAIVCAASLLTHPFAWFLIVEWRGWADGFYHRAIPVEVALTVAEGLFYAALLPVKRWQGLVLSLAANAVSFGYGVLFT